MKFIYFTDIHLFQGHDFQIGFERCLESMLSHDPQLLINGGDLGITPEAISLYQKMTRDLPVPLLMSNGNHEICSGYIPPNKIGTANSSIDIDGVHFIIMDVVRYFEPTEAHSQNWYGLADEPVLAWLEDDLSTVDPETPIIVATHIPLSTTFPLRMGRTVGADFPTNEVTNANRVLGLLKPFDHVATLHGHDHENSRHLNDGIEIMTTAAVAGDWWKQGLDSRRDHSGEPQGYRLLDVAPNGTIHSQYIPITPSQDEPAELLRQKKSRRKFVNIFDGSPQTRVTVKDLGDLSPIDPYAESSKGLSSHLYELPTDFRRRKVTVEITFENGQTCDLVLQSRWTAS
jgi:hypothetical protein